MIYEIEVKERYLNTLPKVDIMKYDPKKVNIKAIENTPFSIVKEGVMLLNVDIVPSITVDETEKYFVVIAPDLNIVKVMDNKEIEDYIVICERGFTPNTLRSIGMSEIEYCNTHSKYPE